MSPGPKQAKKCTLFMHLIRETLVTTASNRFENVALTIALPTVFVKIRYPV